MTNLQIRWLALVVLACAAGCGGTEPPVGDGEEEGVREPVEIRAVHARKDTLTPSFELVATLVAVPEQTAVLAPQVAGQVERVNVVDGQSVKKGDLVAQLDTRTAREDLAKAKAALAEAEAGFALLERGPLPVEVEAARQEARNSAAAAHSLGLKVEALKPLFEKGDISPVQYEQARANAEGAQATQAAAEAKVKLLEGGTRPESVAEGRARMASARAEVSAKELAISLCTITTPIDGTVTELTIRQGAYTQPPNPIATIVDMSTLFARLRLPANLASQVSPGASVEVSVPSHGSDTIAGTLTRIGKTADVQTGDVDAFAVVPNRDLRLGPGLSARARVRLPEVKDAVVVPAGAVSERDGKPVATVVRDGKAHETEIKVGVKTSDKAQIVEGVAAGDIVALEGGYGLPDGSPVKVVDEPGKGQEAGAASP